jgi:hypothetical protein
MPHAIGDRPETVAEGAAANSTSWPSPRRVNASTCGLPVSRTSIVPRASAGWSRRAAISARIPSNKVSRRAPTHREPEPLAIREREVVSQPDFVAVINDRRARQREEDRVRELDAPGVVAKDWCKTPPNAVAVQTHRGLGGHRCEKLASIVRDVRGQAELVVVSEEVAHCAPAGSPGDRRSSSTIGDASCRWSAKNSGGASEKRNTI